MAKIKELTTKLTKTKVSRPGVHAKTKTSQLKSSKKYKKLYDIYYKFLMEFNKELKDNTEKSEKQKDNWISQDELKDIYETTKEKAIPNLLPNRKKDATPEQWDTILKYFIF